jgi:hypothetical protein
MPADRTSAILNLSAPEASARLTAASEIYRHGRGLADRAVFSWWQDLELSRLLLGPKPHVTVGLAVQRETFTRIHAANGSPALADVPPDQDAEEFELHFADGVELDVLTSKGPRGQGAIARYLARFGEGIQQVEFLCLDVERATLILRQRFSIAPLYPQARPGAGSSTINFFLVPVPDAAAESRKVLIELYELPAAPGAAQHPTISRLRLFPALLD